MNRIDDEPIRFYLEHQDRIREWAALEAEVREFADRFYRGLKTDLDAALTGGRVEDDDVELFFHEEGNWPGIALRRQSWPKADEDPDVRLEWNRRNVRFATDGDLWVGVRAKGYGEIFTREACPNYPEKNSWWPVRVTIEGPSGRFWEGDGLKEYRHRVVDTVLSAWNDLAPLVDEAIGI